MALTKTPIELSSTPGIVDNSNATAITIDSSERVLIGKTATGLGASGTEINPNGYIQVTEDQSPPLYLNRLSTDGNIVNFYKDGSSKGSIGTTTSAGGSRFAIGAVGDPGIIFAGTGVFPATQITASDNSADLGSGTYRWKDIYLSGGAFLGGTGAGNKLTDYEEGTFTPHLSFGGVSAGVSWNVQAGKYTKIGNLVTVGVYLYESTGRGSQTGNATVNLPFSLSSSTPDTWLPISNRQGVTAGSNKTLTLYGNAGDASFRFYSGDNSGGNNTVLSHTAFSASGGFEVSFTVTYRTDA